MGYYKVQWSVNCVHRRHWRRPPQNPVPLPLPRCFAKDKARCHLSALALHVVATGHGGVHKSLLETILYYAMVYHIILYSTILYRTILLYYISETSGPKTHVEYGFKMDSGSQTLRLKIAQKTHIIWCLGPKTRKTGGLRALKKSRLPSKNTIVYYVSLLET